MPVQLRHSVVSNPAALEHEVQRRIEMERLVDCRIPLGEQGPVPVHDMASEPGLGAHEAEGARHVALRDSLHVELEPLGPDLDALDVHHVVVAVDSGKFCQIKNTRKCKKMRENPDSLDLVEVPKEEAQGFAKGVQAILDWLRGEDVVLLAVIQGRVRPIHKQNKHTSIYRQPSSRQA